MKQWQLQEAKAKLSHLIHLSTTKGPQGISVRGRVEVVLLSKRKYDNMIGKKLNFVSFLANSPLHGLSLDIERDKSLPRETIEL